MQLLLRNRKRIVNVSLALLFTAGAFGFFGMETSYATFPYVLSSMAMYGLIERTGSIGNPKVKWLSLVFSVLLTASFAAGHQINTDRIPCFPDLSLLDWAYLLPFGGMVLVCVINLVDWIVCHGIVAEKPEQAIGRAYWAKLFAANVLLWMPYFLVFYPGNISLDSFEVIQQSLGVIPYADNHPIAFTVIVGLLIKAGMLIGDINFGIACFTFVQMLAFAGILSYALYWMKKKGTADWIILISGGYYMLNPLIATFSVTMWKDVLFSGCFFLLTLFLYDVYESQGKLLCTKKGIAMLAGISIFLSLWRNGIAFGVGILMLILLLCYKKYAKRLLPVCIAVLCLIFTILGPVYGSLNLPGSHAAESLGVPLQQIGYTLEQGGAVDGDSRAFLEQIIPVDRWAAVYQPGGSDSTKFDAEFNTHFLDNNVGPFLKTWLKLLPANAGHYMKAWLMNSQGYYHIGTYETPVWYGIIPADGVEQMQICRTDLLEEVLKTDLPARLIEAFLFYMNDLPVFNILYSIAANVWVVFLAIVIACLRKGTDRKGALWILIPMAAYWVIIMMTAPVRCSFRYVFNFHLALPVVLLLMFCKRAEETNQ